MLNKGILGVVMMTILGCSQPNIEQSKQSTRTQLNHNQEIVTSIAQTEPFVFVAHLEKLEEEGNTAFYTGILNEKNGCLYIDDHLILVTGVYVKWQNQPFWIGNHHSETFKLGDKVSVGGAEINYSKHYAKHINNSICIASQIWLTLNIDKPFV